MGERIGIKTKSQCDILELFDFTALQEPVIVKDAYTAIARQSMKMSENFQGGQTHRTIHSPRALSSSVIHVLSRLH